MQEAASGWRPRYEVATRVLEGWAAGRLCNYVFVFAPQQFLIDAILSSTLLRLCVASSRIPEGLRAAAMPCPHF
eukprot:1272867-Pyramimonas_sp.AAC.1